MNGKYWNNSVVQELMSESWRQLLYKSRVLRSFGFAWQNITCNQTQHFLTSWWCFYSDWFLHLTYINDLSYIIDILVKILCSIKKSLWHASSISQWRPRYIQCITNRVHIITDEKALVAMHHGRTLLSRSIFILFFSHVKNQHLVCGVKLLCFVVKLHGSQNLTFCCEQRC